MQKPKKPPKISSEDLVASDQLIKEYGISRSEQLLLAETGKLIAYRRVPGVPHNLFPSMLPPYQYNDDDPKPHPEPIPYVPLQNENGEPVLNEWGTSMYPAPGWGCDAIYHAIPKDEIGGFGPEQLLGVFYLKAEINTLLKPGPANQKRTPELDGAFKSAEMELLEPQLKKEKYAFILRSGSWFIKFDEGSKFGNRIGCLKDLKRVRYLVQLLSNPNTDIAADQLIGLVNGEDPNVERRTWTELSSENPTDEGTSREYHEESKKIRQIIKSGKYPRAEIGDMIRLAYKKAQDQNSRDHAANRDNYLALIYSVKDILSHDPDTDRIYWKDANISQNRDNARTLVRNHISAALRDIKKEMPHLYKHLDHRNLKTGTVCRYAPEPPIQWYIRK